MAGPPLLDVTTMDRLRHVAEERNANAEAYHSADQADQMIGLYDTSIEDRHAGFNCEAQM
jgi:hypothetical protein